MYFIPITPIIGNGLIKFLVLAFQTSPIIDCGLVLGLLALAILTFKGISEL